MKPSNSMSIDSYRRLLERQATEEKRRAKKPQHAESHLQRECVSWFRGVYLDHASMLFAVGNGGKRGRVEAAIMKAEGVTAGVSDLILLEARGGYGALCIEMKTTSKDSRQSKYQKKWQQATEIAGNKYVVVRTEDQFKKEVMLYMSQPRTAELGRVVVKGADLTPLITKDDKVYL